MNNFKVEYLEGIKFVDWDNYEKSELKDDCIKYIKDLQQENKQLKEQCEIVEKRLVDEYEDMLDKRNKLFVENCKLKRKLEHNSKINVSDHKYASQKEDEAITYKHIIDELEKWLEEKIQNFKQQIKNFDIWREVGTDINFLILNKQLYQEILNKLQELKGE